MASVVVWLAGRRGDRGRASDNSTRDLIPVSTPLEEAKAGIPGGVRGMKKWCSLMRLWRNAAERYFDVGRL